MKNFGHNVTIGDPYYDKKGYSGARVQAIAVDPLSSIITANNDRRKAGQVSGYWYSKPNETKPFYCN